MRYHYRCTKDDYCTLSDLPEEFHEGKLDIEVAVDSRIIEVTNGSIDPSSPLVWVVEHPMVESPQVSCPLCNESARRVVSAPSAMYFRGNCYLDKVGAQRDMNLYKLQKDDPYGYMREPGEKDDLISRLKKKGRHDPKTQYFKAPSKEIKKSST
jgi:hypothetical protein